MNMANNSKTPPEAEFCKSLPASNLTTSSPPTFTPKLNSTIKATNADSSNVCFHVSESTILNQSLAYGTAISACLQAASPSTNYTLPNYTVPGTNITFSRRCNGFAKSFEMGRWPVRCMEDCMALYAQMNLFPSSYRGKCVSVSWNWDVSLHGLQGTMGPRGSGLRRRGLRVPLLLGSQADLL